MIAVPETPHQRRERGRLTVLGRRSDSGERCTLLMINEVDGSWSFYAAGAPGATLGKTDVIALADKILARAR
ncbi:MAG: hypothetical protein ACRDTD_15225 [Pseudonocardiaceae bacterium]